MNNFNDFLISSIDLSGEVASKSTMISNVVWKYFSDFTKACLIAGNLADLSLDEMQQFESRIHDDIYNVLSVENSVNSRNSFGGTSHESVLEAIKQAKNDI